MKSTTQGFDLSKLDLPQLDSSTKKLFMIIEGIYTIGVQESIRKYGYTEQRYYQLLKSFRKNGIKGLVNHKRGPQNNSIRTEPVINRIIRYRFLDPQSSSQVIAQKLRQEGFRLSARSVERTIQEYGLQKKTLQISSREE
jgi:hypothetical protein